MNILYNKSKSSVKLIIFIIIAFLSIKICFAKGISKIKIFPEKYEFTVNSTVFLTAVAYDDANNPITGVTFDWHAFDNENVEIPIESDGQFTPISTGQIKIVAQAGNQKNEIIYTVTEKPNPPNNLLPQNKTGWSNNTQSSAFEPINRTGINPSTSSVSSLLPTNVNKNTIQNLILDSEAAGSGNFLLSAPIINLAGRGLDLNLALIYNAHVWNQANNDEMLFNPDRGWPAPGWSLGFGKIVKPKYSFISIVVDSDGTRHPVIGATSKVEKEFVKLSAHTTDNTLIDYTVLYYSPGQNNKKANLQNAEVRYPSGTVVNYTSPGHLNTEVEGEIYPTRITDRNGNFITITYRNGLGPEIETITDTLGRNINFHYDADNRLTAITAPGINGGVRTLARLNYREFENSSDNNNVSLVLKGIYYPGTSQGYWFGDQDSYSINGIIKKVSERRNMGFSASNLNEQGNLTAGVMNRERAYNYDGTATQSIEKPQKIPTYTTLTETWDGMDTKPAVTTYQIFDKAEPPRTEITYPNGNKSVQISYKTPDAVQPKAFSDGLVKRTEQYDKNNKLLQATEFFWEKGDYDSPRIKRTETTDELNQKTATDVIYGNSNYNQILENIEYNYGGNQVLRKKHTEYISYASRHIFNLPVVYAIYEGGNTDPVSQIEYRYDNQALTKTPGVVHFSESYDPDKAIVSKIVCTQERECDLDRKPPCKYRNICTTQMVKGPYDPETQYRGNLTEVVNYTTVGNRESAIVETRQYDLTGNLIANLNTACCEKISYSYTVATQYAYPTTVTRGAADPNSAIRVSAQATYDYGTGLLLTATDANGRSVESSYSPLSLRPEHLWKKTAGATDYEVGYIYNDFELTTTESIIDSVHNRDVIGLKSSQMNGLGLVRRSGVLSEGGEWDIAETKYDALGRVWQQSRPFRNGQTPLWGEVFYNALGRIEQIRAADGSRIHNYYNETNRPKEASSEPGQTFRSNGPQGIAWSRTDALGRLVEVVEPSTILNGNGVVTHYSYNGFGQLVEVNHGAQQHIFAYDSLGKQIAKKIPERNATLNDVGAYVGKNGVFSDVFKYDSRGNVVSHTDARGVTTRYDYSDPLNRLKGVFYSTSLDTPNRVAATPDFLYSYMPTGDITRLQSVSAQNVPLNDSFKEDYDYDSKARLNKKTLTYYSRPNNPVAVTYLYDNIDRVSEIRYPSHYGIAGTILSRQTATIEYDVRSRMKLLTVPGGDSDAFKALLTYNQASQLNSMLLEGNSTKSFNEFYDYDAANGRLNHLQATWGGLLQGNTPLLDLSYKYDSYGKIISITNGLDKLKNKGYTYDSLRRLVEVRFPNPDNTSSEVGFNDPNNPPSYWLQQYTYDIYGNRTQSKAFTTKAPCIPPRPFCNPPVTEIASTPSGQQNVVLNEIPDQRDGFNDLAYDPETNRIITAGFEYDDAGNLIRFPRTDTSSFYADYDGAGRLVSVSDDKDSLRENYRYDPSNHRIYMETNSSGNQKKYYYAWNGNQVITEYTENGTDDQSFTWSKDYVYLGGRLLATKTPSQDGASVNTHFADHLSTRLIADNNGNKIASQEHYAFGTEKPGQVLGDNTRRFTSYERSKETGLDYAINRYYDPRQGRFMQPDPLGFGGVSLVNPQSLNMYSYVNNSPVNFIDPLGLAQTTSGTVTRCVPDRDAGCLDDGSIMEDPVEVTGKPPEPEPPLPPLEPTSLEPPKPDPETMDASDKGNISGPGGSSNGKAEKTIEKRLIQIKKSNECSTLRKQNEKMFQQQVSNIKQDSLKLIFSPVIAVKSSISLAEFINKPFQLAPESFGSANYWGPYTFFVGASWGAFGLVAAEEVAGMANLSSNIESVFKNSHNPDACP